MIGSHKSGLSTFAAYASNGGVHTSILVVYIEIHGQGFVWNSSVWVSVYHSEPRRIRLLSGFQPSVSATLAFVSVLGDRRFEGYDICSTSLSFGSRWGTVFTEADATCWSMVFAPSTKFIWSALAAFVGSVWVEGAGRFKGVVFDWFLPSSVDDGAVDVIWVRFVSTVFCAFSFSAESNTIVLPSIVGARTTGAGCFTGCAFAICWALWSWWNHVVAALYSSASSIFHSLSRHVWYGFLLGLLEFFGFKWERGVLDGSTLEWCGTDISAIPSLFLCTTQCRSPSSKCAISKLIPVCAIISSFVILVSSGFQRPKRRLWSSCRRSGK